MKGKNAKKIQGSRGDLTAPRQPEDISGRGKKAIGLGVAALALGFFVLSYSDPMGSNWAAKLAPFLIIAGYVVIGLGIFLPDSGSEKTMEGLSGSSSQVP